MKGGIGNLMKQAQKMQADMQKAQEELAKQGKLTTHSWVTTRRCWKI